MNAIGELIPEILSRAGMDLSRLTIHFDGACEPTNPGGVATCGWIIRDANGAAINTGSKFVCRGLGATNNVAEYCALGFALNWLASVKTALPAECHLDIHGDSKLVICQVKGEWACNRDHLRKLRDRCRELLAQFKTHTLEWIPREANGTADALSRQAYEEHTGKKFPERRR